MLTIARHGSIELRFLLHPGNTSRSGFLHFNRHLFASFDVGTQVHVAISSRTNGGSHMKLVSNAAESMTMDAIITFSRLNTDLRKNGRHSGKILELLSRTGKFEVR